MGASSIEPGFGRSGISCGLRLGGGAIGGGGVWEGVTNSDGGALGTLNCDPCEGRESIGGRFRSGSTAFSSTEPFSFLEDAKSLCGGSFRYPRGGDDVSRLAGEGKPLGGLRSSAEALPGPRPNPSFTGGAGDLCDLWDRASSGIGGLPMADAEKPALSGVFGRRSGLEPGDMSL